MRGAYLRSAVARARGVNETFAVDVDAAQVQFSPESLMALNAVLCLIMFGIALDIRVSDFRRVVRTPKPALVGVLSQFIALPALTFGLLHVLEPHPSIALGMILVAVCPGGNMSNFISLLARGNTALSVSLTAVATVSAVFLTPVNFAFWAGMYAPVQELLRTVSLDFWNMAGIALAILGAPLVVGMLSAHYLPGFSEKVKKPIRILSLIAIVGFIVGALSKNVGPLVEYAHVVAVLVLIHNGVAFLSGYGLAALFRLEERDRRTITIETGIQNSGLALVLIFNFYGGLGGMAVIAAFWGIWHLVAGSTLAAVWRRFPPALPDGATL
jgi:BASS family bile acid:Na+ symporter